MNAVLAIAGVQLRRFFRDKSNYFFVFVFPLLLVVVLGLQFGGEHPTTVAIVGDDSFADRVAEDLENDGVSVLRVVDATEAQTLVARGRATMLVEIDQAASDLIESGNAGEVRTVVGTGTNAMSVSQDVEQTIAVAALQFRNQAALVDRGVTPEDASVALNAASGDAVTLVYSTVGDPDTLAAEFEGLGRFDLGAAQQLALFVFLNSLTAADTLIRSRKLGITQRQLSAAVTPTQVIGGEVLARFCIAAFQALWIVVGTRLLFDVQWGNPVAAALIIVAFCGVSAASAMVMGALLDNESLATGVGVGLGLIVAALGGCMIPLELFPDSLRRFSAVTPHFWSYNAFAELTRRGGGITDVFGPLVVLFAMTAVLLPLGAWLLRRSLNRAL